MFTEQEIETAWSLRQTRKLKNTIIDRRVYIDMLRVFKTRGMVPKKTDRVKYLREWRVKNRSSIREANRKYRNKHRKNVTLLLVNEKLLS